MLKSINLVESSLLKILGADSKLLKDNKDTATLKLSDSYDLKCSVSCFDCKCTQECTYLQSAGELKMKLTDKRIERLINSYPYVFI